MDTGSGDSLQASAALPADKTQKAGADLGGLVADLEKLQLDEGAEASSKQWELANLESDDSCNDSSSSEEDFTPICSYPYGYIKRQTVYTCRTCNDPSKPDWIPAGICIGCRHACHQGHDVVSLETRRHFRCDCGNKKFPKSSPCILCPEKQETNDLNIYNNNYKGTFCTCNCKEAECDAADPLYQCVVCEDWFHASHASSTTEGIEKNYTDLICGTCTPKLDFLRYYDPFDASAAVDDKAIGEMMALSEIESDDYSTKTDASCKLTGLTQKPPYSTGQLWTLGWRGKLCRCVTCKEMYESLGVSFLIDKEDETRRYFEDDEDDDSQEKICLLVKKFEEWLFQMNAQERTEMFQQEPEQVKEKLRQYFDKVKEETGQDLLFEEHLLDQLFESFAEFILNAEGGQDYLLDVDALENLLEPSGEDASGNAKLD